MQSKNSTPFSIVGPSKQYISPKFQGDSKKYLPIIKEKVWKKFFEKLKAAKDVFEGL